MMTGKWNLAFGLVLILATSLACNSSVSTASISGMKISKERNAATETGRFAPTDTIYVVTEISNVPSRVKVKCRILIDDVEGEESGTTVPGSEQEIDFEDAGTATFTYRASGSDGLPPGKYRVEVLMLNENGERGDQKAGAFEIS